MNLATNFGFKENAPSSPTLKTICPWLLLCPISSGASLCSVWPTATYVCVCEENHHETEGRHLHAIVCWNRKVDIKNVTILDGLGGKHGDYRPVRKSKADVGRAISYVKKDGVYLEEGEVPKGPALKQNEAVATMIEQGKTLAEIRKEYKAFVMMNRAKITDYQTLILEEIANAGLPPKLPLTTLHSELVDETGIVRTEYWPDDWAEVALWIEENCTGKPRLHRAKQLYIWGPTGQGKTLLTLYLERFLRVYRMPHDIWIEGYQEGSHELAVCDEFSGCYTISFINEFVQGTPMQLQIKGSRLFKKKNIPVIFLSNRPLLDWYSSTKHSESVLSALVDRFLMVRVGQRAPILGDPTLTK